MSQSQPYRVGIIGFGFIGKVHAYAYRVLPFYYDPVPLVARITHVVTQRPETADRARRLVDAEVGTTDYRAVTENPDVDIVHICTPNHLHAAAIVSAIERQKHIYCDKPLVATWPDAQRIERLLDAYTATSQMTFQNRFFPAMQHARRLVDEGRIGTVLSFRIAYLHGGSASASAPMKWKLSAAAGGGVIADLASHVLDLVEYLAGPIRSVLAATHVAYAERPAVNDPASRQPVDAEDAVVALVRLESGAVGSLEATKIATGMEDEMRVEIHGQRGALRFNLMDPHYLEFHQVPPTNSLGSWQRIDTGQRFAEPATSFPSPKASIGWLRAHVACLANFLMAVADSRPAAPDLRQGIRVQRLMEGLKQSAATGTWQDVNANDRQ